MRAPCKAYAPAVGRRHSPLIRLCVTKCYAQPLAATRRGDIAALRLVIAMYVKTTTCSYRVLCDLNLFETVSVH